MIQPCERSAGSVPIMIMFLSADSGNKQWGDEVHTPGGERCFPHKPHEACTRPAGEGAPLLLSVASHQILTSSSIDLRKDLRSGPTATVVIHFDSEQAAITTC